VQGVLMERESRGAQAVLQVEYLEVDCASTRVVDEPAAMLVQIHQSC
jgi:hypothetical protein